MHSNRPVVLHKVRMAAPMTKLLFLFVLGITSWSRCVAANKVTLTGCNAEVVDGNGVVGSMECRIEDNKLKSNLNVNNCPGVPQLDMLLEKDGAVVSTGKKTLKDPKQELESLCNSVDGPDSGDDSCSMGEGDFELSDCDIESFVSDYDAGDYVAKIVSQIDDADLFRMEIFFTIEAE